MTRGRWLLLCALLLIYSADAPAQRRGSRRATSPPTAHSTETADQFWVAQRNVEIAIQQLEAYLKAHPEGEHAATARQQLEALRGLSLSASRPEWISMNPRLGDRAPQWRITSVERQPDRTRVTIEVMCPRRDGGECYFDPFDHNPLVLVDQNGRYYTMIEAGALPRGVTVTGRERAEVAPGQAELTGGRLITLAVEFAPLAGGAVSVQVYYRDGNRAEPAGFSLLGIR